MAEPELWYVGHARGRWRDEPACKFKGPELSSHLGSVWLAPEASLLKPSVQASLGALSCSLLPFHVFFAKDCLPPGLDPGFASRRYHRRQLGLCSLYSNLQ